ncbi:hypothetical protein B0H16DRAFT_442476 [Mycena metata]|uniref:Cyclase n=1 Tax=Mycena metata TaxID=1033252 RepID=A0AAD7JGF8_9AGAR|nr:hypothetical protein B0H16DRAFT_442476 [Mycena metata]
MASFTALSLLLTASAIFTNAGPIPRQRAVVSRAFNASDPYANWPTYDQLPLDPSFPTKAAWGVWGATDELGALNHINTTTILAAKSEIQTGRVFNLNLDLAMPDPPLNPLRHPLIHDIEPQAGYQDDVITLNTQISTQFDGLRHFPYSTNFSQASYQFYNDLLTFNDIVVPGGSSTLGIQNAAQKGIAGRGILLDWAGWMESKNASFNAFATVIITASDLDAVAQWQGLDPASFAKPGDFLIVRTGFTKQYQALSLHDQDILPFRQGDDMQWVGMEASDATLRWLWDKKLSLVGSDNPTFESAPLDQGTIESPVPRSLHQVFIGGWGQSIVEFLDLETLTPACHELQRYSFFFTLQNLNVVGGIASPPNAMAIL